MRSTKTRADRVVASDSDDGPAADDTANGSVTSDHYTIAEAIGQLDSVIDVTEIAANQIMDACDALMALQGTIGGALGEQIRRAVTTIFEACGFQDLTGQRIVKVAKTLRLIDQTLSDLIQTGLGTAAEDFPANAVSQRLQGPRERSVVIDQSVADRLFAQIELEGRPWTT
jgi:chemotaxis protein CheZ